MFESTIEAQGLNVGEKRLGTLSAAALAHVGIGLAIVAVTALIVPPVQPPEPPPPPFAIISLIPKGDLTPRPAPAPAPKKGTDTDNPARALEPPPVAPVDPPEATPETLQDVATDTAPQGPEGPGEGTPGDPTGSEFGTPGALGDGETGSGAGPGDGTGGDPLVLTGDMVRPMLLEKVAPAYPQAARLARLGGRVTVQAVIAPDGSVESVEVLSSTNPLFDAAAIDAVRRWRYRPALMNGKPVRVYFTVMVDFVLR